MTKKSIFIFLLVISIICYLVLQNYSMFSQFSQNDIKKFSDLNDRDLVEIMFDSDKEIQLGQESITVEIVNTQQSTSQGLSGREKIGVDGMLFIFPEIEKRYFWMKDMKFDLDIIWIVSTDDSFTKGKILEISKNVLKPKPETPDFKLETYSPEEAVNMVLELNIGDAEKFNIKPGDVVKLVE